MSNEIGNGQGVARQLRDWIQVAAIIAAAVVSVMAIRATTDKLQVQLADLVEVLREFKTEMHITLADHEQRIRAEENIIREQTVEIEHLKKATDGKR